ncbi:Bug family tripartite tricarboxylate transporter substrate binding protein [Variovorax saccharolyticus]|uniref:Bug family tripartite tricarboxylate transporter substrate binding protein n=1 Tax=Variovorax saccharolyticus TaxID=3053516 RepID=UPI002578EF68|nr:Bug family tripartite tricarboxylate transporter substrate binding protein [Variovorax sp. J31P216]MDM0026285.1 Bug family tripartite tricarboxylate transporter substrate binding protein [Variovorax sp. J31P216]
MWNRRELLQGGAALSALASLGLGRTAWAQLNGNAAIISGFPAGGMGDNVARPVAERLRGRYATSLVVEARTGAGGRIAVEYVKRAAPDGLTILQIPSSPMTLYPHTYKKLNYDPLTDFAPVCSTVTYAFSFTAGPGLPAEVKTVADYVAWARANPKLATYGVPAAGSALHFAGMMLQKAAGIEMSAIPYRGGAPLLNDVMGGQVPVSFNVIGEVMPHVRSGKLRSLAITSAERSPFLPEVPTMVEQGYKDIAVQEWLGWFLPARTPPDLVLKLNALVGEALQAPDLVAALATHGLQPVHQSPQEFARLVKAGFDKWAPIVRATGFTAED